MKAKKMNILVVGATGSIGRHVVEIALSQGHNVIALCRSLSKASTLPNEARKIFVDITEPETLKQIDQPIDAVVFTMGSDGLGKKGAMTVDYGGVRNILMMLKGKNVRIALMTSVGVTNREGNYNRRTEAHDWKRRSERLLRASGHPYTIIRPGWFDYNNDDEHKLVMLQGDQQHTGTPQDGVISRRQIAEVLLASLVESSATEKTLELSAEKGAAQTNLSPLFAALTRDREDKNDGPFDLENMDTSDEPTHVQNDLREIRSMPS